MGHIHLVSLKVFSSNLFYCRASIR